MYKGERLNSITHLIGTVAAISGAAILIVLAARSGDALKIVSFSIYGASLVFLYLSSTLYHSFSGPAKKLFQKFDHGAIYVLIAGTYTPYTLVTMRGSLGWFYFGLIWSLAVVGIAIDLLHKGGRRILPVVLYVAMGWIAVTAIRPLVAALSHAGFFWLLAGGVSYTSGVIFYALDRKMPYSHEIWHLFVLGGSACHFVSVLLYVR
jgi:hemolysin III